MVVDALTGEAIGTTVGWAGRSFEMLLASLEDFR